MALWHAPHAILLAIHPTPSHPLWELERQAELHLSGSICSLSYCYYHHHVTFALPVLCPLPHPLLCNSRAPRPPLLTHGRTCPPPRLTSCSCASPSRCTLAAASRICATQSCASRSWVRSTPRSDAWDWGHKGKRGQGEGTSEQMSALRFHGSCTPLAASPHPPAVVPPPPAPDRSHAPCNDAHAVMQHEVPLPPPAVLPPPPSPARPPPPCWPPPPRPAPPCRPQPTRSSGGTGTRGAGGDLRVWTEMGRGQVKGHR